MKISNRCQYAVKILVDLSHYHQKSLVHIDEIAKRQNIPKNYLEQIILNLKKGGYVKSKKGPQGGYELAQNAQEISVKSIVEYIEGRIFPCTDTSKEKDIYLEFWESIGDKLDKILGETTIDILRQKEQKQFERKSLHFEI